MNRRAFIRGLIKEGCVLERHGRKHDIYLNPKIGKTTTIPRHSEIKDSLCRLIRKQLGLDQ